MLKIDNDAVLKDPRFISMMKDPLISKKYDRARRIKTYSGSLIPKYLPRIKNGGGRVMDIGPGALAFLEVCRAYGNRVVGLEASEDFCRMPPTPSNYLRFYKLLAEITKIPVIYGEIVEMLGKEGRLPFTSGTFTEITSMHSIQMVFGRFCGHHVWPEPWPWVITGALVDSMELLWSEFHRLLRRGGRVYIIANTTCNDAKYGEVVKRILSKMDKKFRLLHSERSIVHLVEKV